MLLVSASAEGENAWIVCSVVNAGRKMAAIRAGVYDVNSGKLCLTGENGKANTVERAWKTYSTSHILRQIRKAKVI